MGTGTSRGRETPRTKKCMDCQRGVPQGDHKEAGKPRGPLPPGGFSLVPIRKKRDRFCGCRFVQSHVNDKAPLGQARINSLHATRITSLVNTRGPMYVSILKCVLGNKSVMF